MQKLNTNQQAYIFGGVFVLSNRLQTAGDKIDNEISVKQWFVLSTIFQFRNSIPNIGEIAEITGTSRQNIKKIALILQNKGYLRLEQDLKDKRIIRLVLTTQCHDYFESRKKQENEYLSLLFDGFGAEDISNLSKSITKLLDNEEKIRNASKEQEKD